MGSTHSRLSQRSSKENLRPTKDDPDKSSDGGTTEDEASEKAMPPPKLGASMLNRTVAANIAHY